MCYLLNCQCDCSPHLYDILAVSVEDNGHYCQDANELAIIKAEGCTGGAFWRAVNTIADALKAEFVSISVLADAYAFRRHRQESPSRGRMSSSVIARSTCISPS